MHAYREQFRILRLIRERNECRIELGRDPFYDGIILVDLVKQRNFIAAVELCTLQARGCRPLFSVVDIVKLCQMIKFQRAFCIEQQVFALRGTAAVALRFRFPFRIPEADRRTAGFDRVRFAVPYDFLTCRGLFYFVIVHPLLKCGRQSGILFREKGDFKHAGDVVIRKRHDPEQIPENHKSEQQAQQIVRPAPAKRSGAFSRDLPAGERLRAVHIEEHEKQDEIRKQQPQIEHTRDQRAVDDQEYADEKQVGAVPPLSVHQEDQGCRRKGFQHGFVGQSPLFHTEQAPRADAAEDEAVHHDPQHGRIDAVRDEHDEGTGNDCDQEPDPQLRLPILPQRTRKRESEQERIEEMQRMMRRSPEHRGTVHYDLFFILLPEHRHSSEAAPDRCGMTPSTA